MNTNITAYTKKNTKLTLAFLGSGGEGDVYEIVGYPNKVAKLYHQESSDAMSKREAKIDAMVTMRQSPEFVCSSLDDVIAWPWAPLYDEHGKFIGFGMDRISASTELDDLYVYPPKISYYMKDKITCLISMCDVIERLHDVGQVFGDFNPNNIKINSDWSICFVDADSYHIHKSGREYRCIACAPGYVAPEVIHACKGSSYAECPRTTFTKESDLFSLAVHIFRMLFNGCHPYGCERQMRNIGSAPAPKPIDTRVEKGDTLFFKTIPDFGPPSYAPDIKSFPQYIQDLFHRAFVDGHSIPLMRPSTSEWKRALIKYRSELKECKYNRAHSYWKGAKSCPYCDADQRYYSKNNVRRATTIPSAAVMQTAPSITTTYTGNAYQPKNTTSATVTAQKAVGRAPAICFWFTTVIISVITQYLLTNYVLAGLYVSVFNNELLSMIGIVGSAVSGVVGTIVYNHMWTLGRFTGRYSWWEYCLSILISIGFSIGFGLALGIVVVVLYVLFYLIVGAVILAILFGVLAGG